MPLCTVPVVAIILLYTRPHNIEALAATVTMAITVIVHHTTMIMAIVVNHSPAHHSLDIAAMITMD